MNRRYCFTLDLKNDPRLINEYRKYHEKIWPEITKSITDSGIRRHGDLSAGRVRMFMIVEVNDGFSFETKAPSDLSNPKLQEWEQLMSKFRNRYLTPSRARNG